MRLWLRFALVIAAVSALSLLFFGTWAQWATGTSATEAAVAAQLRDARAIATSVGRWLDGQSDFLLGWAGTFPVATLDPERQTGLLRAVLTSVPSAVTVVLVDGDGQLVVDPVYLEEKGGGSEQRALALVERLPVTGALESSAGLALGAFWSPDGVHTSVPIAVVASEDPPIVLGADIDLVVAAELSAQSSATRAVLLVDGAKTVVGPPHPLLRLDLVEGLLGNLADFAYQSNGTDVQGAAAPVSGTDWSIVVLEPAEVALEPANRIRRSLIFAVSLAMVVATLLGFVMGRWFTEPIARLRDTALVLAEGRYGARAEVESQDEVGELARAFNHLSSRLKENQGEILRQRSEIEAFNQELQQRVDAATADLREAQEHLVRSGQLAAVAQLGAGMAHELNNPLMAILGLTQILRARAGDGGMVGVLDDLEAEAARCRDVLDALLKLTNGEEPAGSASARLDEILADVRTALVAAIRDSGVTVEWVAIPEVAVAVDAALAVGAFGQLVAALLKGLPRGATLTVSAELESNAAVVLLAPDQEVGIVQDDWMASGLDVWVARQTLDRFGGQLVEPLDDSAAWRVRLPRA
ncbi:MAG: HAMP domain-containing protein [Alphaproteobacteria bacterium]|nr:HAMP domain-containing protein [Alphaproteobacteria bacterium]